MMIPMTRLTRPPTTASVPLSLLPDTGNSPRFEGDSDVGGGI